jgi:adenylate cyclase class 2
MTQDSVETEIKLRVTDRVATLDVIRRAGFSESVPRVFEANTLYDSSSKELRARGMLLRVRQVDNRGLLTWKGPSQPGPHKSRPELETAVVSPENMAGILEQLGYQPFFRYEKYRTEYSCPNAEGTLTVDETPIGDFLELEGPGDWIDSTAEQLGFSRDDYVLDSYGRLYLAHCERHGLEPTHMTFASHD